MQGTALYMLYIKILTFYVFPPSLFPFFLLLLALLGF